MEVVVFVTWGWTKWIAWWPHQMIFLQLQSQSGTPILGRHTWIIATTQFFHNFSSQVFQSHATNSLHSHSSKKHLDADEKVLIASRYCSRRGDVGSIIAVNRLNHSARLKFNFGLHSVFPNIRYKPPWYSKQRPAKRRGKWLPWQKRTWGQDRMAARAPWWRNRRGRERRGRRRCWCCRWGWCRGSPQSHSTCLRGISPKPETQQSAFQNFDLPSTVILVTPLIKYCHKNISKLIHTWRMMTTMLRTGLKKQNWRVPCLQNLENFSVNFSFKNCKRPEKANVVTLSSQATCAGDIASPKTKNC